MEGPEYIVRDIVEDSKKEIVGLNDSRLTQEQRTALRKTILEEVERRRQAGERPKLPKGHQWLSHDKSGGRAAQRRLKQMQAGQIPAGQVRCDACGQWYSALGVNTDDPQKPICHACAVGFYSKAAIDGRIQGE